MKSLFYNLSIIFILSISCNSENDTNTPIQSDCGFVTTNYPMVTIGNQIWMQKNLDVCTYRNGDQIPHIQDQTEWANLNTGAWCFYENISENGVTYGKLYNWYAVNDSRGLAPDGWHIPSDDEWTILTDFLGGAGVAGGKLKATTLWDLPNTGSTNSSGFTAFPGGVRYINMYDNIGNSGLWWTSTVNSNTLPWYRQLSNFSYNVGRNNINKVMGFSVRCIKD